MKTFLKIALVLIVLGIAYLSLTPLETITIGNDKISHFIAYGTLMTTAGLLTWGRKPKLFLAIGLSLLYGCLIEVGQHFVPGRDMSFFDIIANSCGVIIGTTISLIIYKIIGNKLGLQ